MRFFIETKRPTLTSFSSLSFLPTVTLTSIISYEKSIRIIKCFKFSQLEKGEICGAAMLSFLFILSSVDKQKMDKQTAEAIFAAKAYRCIENVKS